MRTKAGNRLKKVVVIGGSQGAIEALLQIMPSLPADLPTALSVVVHLPIEANSFVLAGMREIKGGRLRRFSGSPCEDAEKSVTKSGRC